MIFLLLTKNEAVLLSSTSSLVIVFLKFQTLCFLFLIFKYNQRYFCNFKIK